ncbi:unannotated protein [freshwater metagenome]|uniref:Unannotated protein n=1 Tax=freshwater metagenome TaxID=449393 RepID=A0A6J7HEJ1_9ZZZZ
MTVLPLKTETANATDLSIKSEGSKTASTTPKASASLAFIIVLLLSALSIITCTARSGPISFGSMVAPPQPGTKPKKTSGRPVNAVLAKVLNLQ